MTAPTDNLTFFNRIYYPGMPPRQQAYTGYIQWIKENGPFSHYFTVTFAPRVDENKRVKLYSELTRRLNRRFFGKRKAAKGVHMNGFCFIEKNKSGDIHFHTVVQHNDNFYISGKPTFRTHLVNEMASLFEKQKNLLSSQKGLDCQPIHPEDDINISHGLYEQRGRDRLIKYCVKDMRYDQNLNTDKVHFRRANALGPEGISPRDN